MFNGMTKEQLINSIKACAHHPNHDCESCDYCDDILCYNDQLVEDFETLMNETGTKTGHWIPFENPTGIEAFGIKEMTVTDVRCSVCGAEEDVSFTGYKYCPRCGAKMEGR